MRKLVGKELCVVKKKEKGNEGGNSRTKHRHNAEVKRRSEKN